MSYLTKCQQPSTLYTGFFLVEFLRYNMTTANDSQTSFHNLCSAIQANIFYSEKRSFFLPSESIYHTTNNILLLPGNRSFKLVSHQTTSDTPDQDHLKEDYRWNPCSNPAHNSPSTATTTASCNHAPALRSLRDDILEMDQPSPQRLHLRLAESFDSSAVNARHVLDRPIPDHGSAPILTTNGHHILRRPSEGTPEMRQPILPTLQPSLAERSGSSSSNTRSVVGRFDPALASTRIATTSGIHASRPVCNGTLETRQPLLQPLQSDMAGVSGSSSMNAGVVVRRLESLHISATMDTTNTSHAPRPLGNDALEMRQPSPQSLQPNLTEGPGISSGQRAYMEALNELLLRAETVLDNTANARSQLAVVQEQATVAERGTLQANQYLQRLLQDFREIVLQRSTAASPRLRPVDSHDSHGENDFRRTGSSRSSPHLEESPGASAYLTPSNSLAQTLTTSANSSDIVNDRALSIAQQQHANNRDETDNAALPSSVSTEHSPGVPASAARLCGLPTDVPPLFRVTDFMYNTSARISSPVDPGTGSPVPSESGSAPEEAGEGDE